MVDEQKILKKLYKYFWLSETPTVDPQTGQVSVMGDVFMERQSPRIPVQFHHVSGKFHCQDMGLTSLVGSPRIVDHDFQCQKNQLTSLKGAPDHVGKDFWCHENKLTNLVHMPSHVGGDFWCIRNPLISLDGWDSPMGGEFFCEYYPNLPLLRTIQAQKVDISFIYQRRPPAEVQKILNKYAGKGKTHMLNCALELKKAGYEGNARW